MKAAGFEIRVDPRVPEDEIWFEQDKILVGKIVGVTLPEPWYKRLWRWLKRGG